MPFANASVTALAYHFWDDAAYDREAARIAHAFRQTWKFCGRLPSVLVVNKVMPSIERFAGANANLSIQVEPSLKPGSVYTLSCDCNSRLATRFDTDYVLTIQHDGWPLRPWEGESPFKWDYIGAPLVRDRWYIRLASKFLDRHQMNGGFSLRSRECCEQVAYWWNKKYHAMGDCLNAAEDIFTTEFLPAKEPSFRKAMKFPDVVTAIAFSWHKLGNEPFRRETLPFGFHTMASFRELSGKWRIE